MARRRPASRSSTSIRSSRWRQRLAQSTAPRAPRRWPGTPSPSPLPRFAVPDPWQRPPGRYCTYLVAYEGPAEDEAAWLAYYLEHHPPLMAKLPGIRELEIYTPLQWRCPPALKRVRHLQRNKVAFDSPAALAAALDSPVRREMRADFAQFPRHCGGVTHY